METPDRVDNRIAQSSLDRERPSDARRSVGKVFMSMPKNFVTEDVAVPISYIPEMMRRVQERARQTGLGMVTVGHAEVGL